MLMLKQHQINWSKNCNKLNWAPQLRFSDSADLHSIKLSALHYCHCHISQIRFRNFSTITLPPSHKYAQWWSKIFWWTLQMSFNNNQVVRVKMCWISVQTSFSYNDSDVHLINYHARTISTSAPARPNIEQVPSPVPTQRPAATGAWRRGGGLPPGCELRRRQKRLFYFKNNLFYLCKNETLGDGKKILFLSKV